jgi:hypothetical protein
VPAILRLVENSDLLTIVLISSGEAKIQGTPFDDQINRVFDTWRTAERKASAPFITVLRAGKGRVTDCATTQGQWEVELPALPAPESEVARVPKTVSESSAPKPRTEVVPSLIIIGAKSRPQETPTAPPPAVAPEVKPATASPPLAVSGQGPPGDGGTSAAQKAAATPLIPPTGTNTGRPDARENSNPEVSARLIAVTGPELVKPVGFSRRQGFGLAALVFAVGGLGLFFFLRRATAPTTSLITQSLEHGAGLKTRAKKEPKPARRKIDDV